MALGVLSTVQAFGCQYFMSKTRCRTMPDVAASRRQRLRVELRAAPALGRNNVVALHFLIAGVCGNSSSRATGGDNASSCGKHESYMRRLSDDALAAAYAEQAREGDLHFLSTHEDQLGGCSLKYISWLEAALTLYPHAAFVALADDDVYIQFQHLAADLARVVTSERRSRDELILWGFLFWRPFYNNASMSMAEGIDYQTHDASVSKQRYSVERCKWEKSFKRPPGTTAAAAAAAAATAAATAAAAGRRDNASRGDRFSYCALLHPREREMVERGEIDEIAPMPIMNGPLFALSAPLARAISPMGRRWLRRFKQTALVDWARTRQRIPYRIRDIGCWP